MCESEDDENMALWMTHLIQQCIIDTDEWEEFEQQAAERFPDASPGQTVLVRRARCSLDNESRAVCVGDFVLRRGADRVTTEWDRVAIWYADHETSPVTIDFHLVAAEDEEEGEEGVENEEGSDEDEGNGEEGCEGQEGEGNI